MDNIMLNKFFSLQRTACKIAVLLVLFISVSFGTNLIVTAKIGNSSVNKNEQTEVPDWVYPPKIEYSSVGKNNPFIPLYPQKPGNIDEAVPLLERYATGQVLLKGVMEYGQVKIAVFALPDNKGAIGRVGDKIGQRGGVITEITREFVRVVEPVKNIFNEAESHTVTLYLQSEGKLAE